MPDGMPFSTANNKAMQLPFIFLILAEAAADPARPAFTSLDDIQRLIPAGTPLQKPTKDNAAAFAAANSALSKGIGGLTQIKARVESVKPDDYGWRVRVPDTRIRSGSKTVISRTFLYFRKADGGPLATLKKGDEVTVTGKITRADFTWDDGIVFNLDLRECAAAN